jgi:hypothetical protein
MAASIPSLGPKNKTIGSHPLIGYLLDIYTLNNLLLLFDGNKDKNYENHNMAQYVKEERKEMGLDTSNTTVGSYLYDNIRRPDPALHLQITKNGNKRSATLKHKAKKGFSKT